MKRDFIFIIALIFLQGYTTVPEFWDSVPPSKGSLIVQPASLPTSTPFIPPPAPAFIITPTPVPVSTPTPFAVPTVDVPSVRVERVLIVSFDGMRPDAIKPAKMTNLLGLIETGAYTLKARTINYPTTLPSHTSMLTGLCMEKHGMAWNGNNLYRGYAKGDDIFELTTDAGMRSVMSVGKEKLRLIAEPETTDEFHVDWSDARIAQAAIDLISDDFDLMFVHFPTADIRGHKFGWMSRSQLKALTEGDEALGQILAALEERQMLESTLIIVTSDHGGHDKTHDGTRVEDYLIPWVAVGPGIVPGEVQNPVKTMDTAATAAYALGLPIPPEWDGLPVYEAFGIIAQDVHYNDNGCE